jgi:hypothetical protein
MHEKFCDEAGAGQVNYLTVDRTRDMARGKARLGKAGNYAGS